MCLETLLCPLITWKTSWAGSTLPMELPFPSFQAKQCSCLAEGQQLCQCQSWSGAGLTFSTRPELTLVWEMIPFPGTGVSCIQPSCRPALHLCNIRALDRLNDILSVWRPGRRMECMDVECRGCFSCCGHVQTWAGQAASCDPSAGPEPSLANHFSPPP